MKQVAGTMRLDLAQYRELAAFAQFGSDLDKATKAQLDRGARMVETLKQAQYSPLPVEDQVLTIFTAVRGHLSDIPVDKVVDFHRDFLKFMHAQYPDIGKRIAEQKKLDDALEADITKAINAFKDTVTYKIAEG
jgi:F-type H+-transporting ATPase subunit alpha